MVEGLDRSIAGFGLHFIRPFHGQRVKSAKNDHHARQHVMLHFPSHFRAYILTDTP